MMVRRLSALLIPLVLVSCSRKINIEEANAKGDKAMEQDQLSEAVLQYRLAEQADQKRGDVRLKLSAADLKQRDARNALQEVLRGADLLPNDASAQVRAGSMLLLARQYDDAKARAERALAIDPKNADALVLKGN